ncbi:Probable low-affinity inorganic phosphate transporter [hydrothermal vent metagenome]|uniref:Probable low-affinity inorganic phosphate transporter n=1 Tax=hydrothermal vent metagenome TaxID=652676 RepID=A0A3B1BIH1_9ZZZZ
MPDQSIVILIVAITLSVGFNFVNGFHDAANTIATSIGSRALTIPAALSLAAVFNFLGAFVSHKVAYTVATGVVAPSVLDNNVIIAAMLSAILWNLVTWYFAAPSSSSHALISALFGAALMKTFMEGSGFEYFNWPSLLKIIIALFTSPIVGLFAGYVFFKLIVRLTTLIFPKVSTHKPNRLFARLQIVSAAFMSFSHGMNDAQKTMGIVALALFQGGWITEFVIPFWVTALCALAISLGSLVGGLRIIKTVAKKITDLQPVHGFCAELGSASVIFGASLIGMPVSTTHIATSSVVGVGSAKSVGKVRRNIVMGIVSAWVITIPVTLIGAAVAYWVIS